MFKPNSDPQSLDPIRKDALKGPVDPAYKELLKIMPGSGSHTHVARQLL
jgi:hypothetical protein